MTIQKQVTGDRWQVPGTGRAGNLVTCHSSRVTRAGFTMVEIAICLAIIGIALVAIIGVLPAGLNVQKDNREETLIDQDATVFIENIRNGARGLDDLTNYVLAITNSWTLYNADGTVSSSGVNGYNLPSATAYGTVPSRDGAHQRREHYRASEHAGIYLGMARPFPICFSIRRLQQLRCRLRSFSQRTGGGKTAAGQ